MLSSQEQMEIIKVAIESGYKGPVYKLIEQAIIERGAQQQAQQQAQQSQTPTVGIPALGGKIPGDPPTTSTERNIIQPGQYETGGFKYENGGGKKTQEEIIAEQNRLIDLMNSGELPNTSNTNKSILSNTISTTQGSKYYNKDGTPMTFEEKNVKVADDKEATKKHVIQAKEDITEFLTDPVKAGDAIGMTGIPIVSEAGDLLSAAASTYRGNYGDASLSMAGIAVPFAGGAVLKQGKNVGKKVYNVLDRGKKAQLNKQLSDLNQPGIVKNTDAGYKQITNRKDLLKEYNLRNNAYRTVNIGGDVMKNEELLKQAKKYGFDPSDPKQLAEFMGTTPTGGVGNRAGFSGVRGRSDIVYYGDFPGQTHSRYGRYPDRSAYTSKINIFEDDISKLSNDQIYDRISALDNIQHNDPSMGIFNTKTDLKSLDEIPHGGVINTNIIHPPGISTTTQIVGRQNIPIRQPKGILSGDEIMELTNRGKDPFKTFQKGGFNSAYQKGGVKKEEEFPGLLPEVEVSALTDESYNKLSSPQKQIYDTFKTPRGVAQTVNIGEDREMHWKDALKMTKDLGIRNISNKNSWLFQNLFERSPEAAKKGNITAHANVLMRNVTIPEHKGPGHPNYNKFNQDVIDDLKENKEYWVKQLSKEEREIRIREIEANHEDWARKDYFDDLFAEYAHIPEFWRIESLKNAPVSAARDIYRFVTGQEIDHSRYKDPHHTEYHTHTGPDSFEEKLKEKYKIKQKGGFKSKYQVGGLNREKPRPIMESKPFQYPTKREELNTAIDRVVDLEKESDRPKIKKMLQATNFVENSMGNNPKAYNRSYTNSQASIDPIMFTDLFSPKIDDKGKSQGFTATQKKYFKRLEELGLPSDSTNFKKELQDDNPLAATYAMRMVYGKSSESIPEVGDAEKAFKYYNKYYRKNNKITDLTESRKRFYEGYKMKFKRGGYKSKYCW